MNWLISLAIYFFIFNFCMQQNDILFVSGFLESGQVDQNETIEPILLRKMTSSKDCDKLKDDDVCRNVSELITSKGYPCEEFSVTTEDGFILGLQRIPYGRMENDKRVNLKPVVFLQHGLLDSSATWVINSDSQSLGFILADAGFDVWLGNMRGNTYSRRHTRYQPSEDKFWKWSWDEMAKYDMPASLEFILSMTGLKNLFYIGHSQGTLIAFARLSEDENLAKKIKAFIALGPVATVGHIKGAVRLMAEISPEAEFLFHLFGIHEFLPNDDVIKFMASKICHEEFIKYICEDIIFLISGFDSRQLNISRLPVYFSHTPAGTSVQNIVHFAQMVKSKRFQMFDFGSKEQNMQHYNQSIPPMYNISNFKVPTYMFSAANDYLADPQDVEMLLNNLSCIVEHLQIPNWEHLDFIWGLDAEQILYKNIIHILQKLS